MATPCWGLKESQRRLPHETPHGRAGADGPAAGGPCWQAVMKRPASRLASSGADWVKLPVTQLPVLKKPAATWKRPSAHVEEGDELCLGGQVPPHGGSLPVKKLRALQYFSKFMRGTTPAALAPKKSSPQNLNADAKLDVA